MKRIFLVAPYLWLVACGPKAVPQPAPVETPRIVAETVEFMNINIKGVIIGDGTHQVIAQQLGQLIGEVAADIASGKIKPTQETKWAQIHVVLGGDPDTAQSIGTFRVPIERLKHPPQAGDVDHRQFLDLVDYIEDGPAFDSIISFCHVDPSDDAGQSFCRIVDQTT